MPKDNDNRMRWIRNLEALASENQQYTVKYELGSECRIAELLDYADGKIICAAMNAEESRNGLRLHNHLHGAFQVQSMRASRCS